jgi:hypothetical protein
MSTPPGGLPYLAPWVTGFNRYSTQPINMPITSHLIAGVTVPKLQWWRIVAVTFTISTSTVVKTRVAAFEIVDPTNSIVLVSEPPLQIGASIVAHIQIAPNTSFSSTTGAPNRAFGSGSVPDMLWGQDYLLRCNAVNADTSDVLGESIVFAEIYTEDYNSGVLTPALVPTPLLV